MAESKRSLKLCQIFAEFYRLFISYSNDFLGKHKFALGGNVGINYWFKPPSWRTVLTARNGYN